MPSFHSFYLIFSTRQKNFATGTFFKVAGKNLYNTFENKRSQALQHKDKKFIDEHIELKQF